MPSKRATINSQSVSESFRAKKQQIIASLSIPADEYADKSPKGSVDSQIVDLIDQINEVEGWVTTSSCAGRVSVFVEGMKGVNNDTALSDVRSRPEENSLDAASTSVTASSKKQKSVPAGPGGKGHGGRWLFVSHEPFLETEAALQGKSSFTELFGLTSTHSGAEKEGLVATARNDHSNVTFESETANLRLIRLSFSPLILHVHAASLFHAKPLLAAAINAGFRESGVQSLKALEDPEAGTMVAIRTAGLAFETVIGYLRNDEDDNEITEGCVSEDYLRMCVHIINAKFAANVERRERLEEELKKVSESGTNTDEVEDSAARRARKREEGLRKQQEKRERQAGKHHNHIQHEEDQSLNAETLLQPG